MKIKKGDNVIVLTGKDRGREGLVVRSWPELDRVVVEGINLVKRRERARQQGKKGQVVERPAPLHVSNVALKCAKCKKGVRVGMKEVSGKRTRVCKTCGASL